MSGYSQPHGRDEVEFWEWMRAVAPPPLATQMPHTSNALSAVDNVPNDWDAAYNEDGSRAPPPPPPNYFYDLPDDLRRKIEAPWAADLLLKRWLTAQRPPEGVDVDDCGGYPEPEPAPLYWAVDNWSLEGLKYALGWEAMRAKGPDLRVLELLREERARLEGRKYADGRPIEVCACSLENQVIERWPEMKFVPGSELQRCRAEDEVRLALLHTKPPDVFDRLAPKFLKLLAFMLLGPDYEHYVEEPICCYYEDPPDWWGCAPCPKGSWRLNVHSVRGMSIGPGPTSYVADPFPWSKERKCHFIDWMRMLPVEILKATVPDPRDDEEYRLDLSHHRWMVFGEYLDLALTPKQQCWFAWVDGGGNGYRCRFPKLAKQEWVRPHWAARAAGRMNPYWIASYERNGECYEVARSYAHVMVRNKRHGPVYPYGLK